MNRRKTGRDLSGWLILDKPAGVTSTAAVNKVRWALDARKAGHAGTLDPAATGLLAIALGEATKTVPVVMDALKCYSFTVRFGLGTTTDDAEGEEIARSDHRPTDAEITAALSGFLGDILQTPPRFSAVKIGGERAYNIARAGGEAEIQPRPLFVDELLLTDRPDPDHADLELTCGKGGYVRAIARDLGETLGTPAHVTTLRRLWSGPFDLEDAVSWEHVEALARSPDLDRHILSLETGLADLPCQPVRPEDANRLRHGNPVPATLALDHGTPLWAAEDGEAVALGTLHAGQFRPTRVLLPR